MQFIYVYGMQALITYFQLLNSTLICLYTDY